MTAKPGVAVLGLPCPSNLSKILCEHSFNVIYKVKLSFNGWHVPCNVQYKLSFSDLYLPFNVQVNLSFNE